MQCCKDAFVQERAGCWGQIPQPGRSLQTLLFSDSFYSNPDLSQEQNVLAACQVAPFKLHPSCPSPAACACCPGPSHLTHPPAGCTRDLFAYTEAHITVGRPLVPCRELDKCAGQELVQSVADCPGGNLSPVLASSPGASVSPPRASSPKPGACGEAAQS